MRFRRGGKNRTRSATIKTDHSLDLASGEDVDDRGSIEIVPLAKLQRSERVAKGRRFFQIGRPFIHVSEEQPGFYIFQDRLHRVCRLAGVLIFANDAHLARRAPMKNYSANQEES